MPADPALLGDGVVSMADPNHVAGVRTEQEVKDHVKAAFPDAGIVENPVVWDDDGNPLAEVDVIVDGVPVEATIGRGKDKFEQAGRITRHLGEPPIVYGPRLGGTVERNLREAGYTVVRNLDDLERAMRERGVG